MQGRHALRGFGLVTLVYLAALLWLDNRRQLFSGLPALGAALGPMLAASVCSYLVRFLRWHGLLVQAGHRVPVQLGLPAYLAGFAFTATPGKVGELLRIRYLQDAGVPPARTLAAFVFERAMDLLAVLLLASLFIHRHDILALGAAFVVLLIGTLAIAATHPAWMTRLAAHLRACHARLPSRAIRILRDGLTGCRIWLRPRITAQAMLLGLLAWGITAWSFVHLLRVLEMDIPQHAALSIYPLAMLAGAASMLPGGLGSTEATIIVLLVSHGIDWQHALLAAIGIRVASFWFSILLGLACMAALEWRRWRRTAAS